MKKHIGAAAKADDIAPRGTVYPALGIPEKPTIR
jgi:hypothetical protein